MTTSQTDTSLYEPTGNALIDPATRLYFGGLARHFGHELLLEAFEQSGLSKADLAARLGYDPSRLGRILNTPANLTLETFGQVLFAIDGSCAHFSQQWPLREQSRNYQGPDWLGSGTLASGSQNPIKSHFDFDMAVPLSSTSNKNNGSVTSVEMEST